MIPEVHEKGHICHWCGSSVDPWGDEMWVYEQRNGVKTRVYYPACEGCKDA